MGTGYTARVKTGEESKFEDFLLSSAISYSGRNQDGPERALERRVVSPLYYSLVARTKRAIAKLEAETAEDLKERLLSEDEIALNEEKAMLAEIELARERYEAMIVEVEAWEPPTEEHVGLKEFMLKQLQLSLESGCGERAREVVSMVKRPSREEAAFRRDRELEHLREDLARREAELAAQERNIAERNAWMDRVLAEVEVLKESATKD